MRLTRQTAVECLAWVRRLFIPVALVFLLYSAYVAGHRLAPVIAGLSIKHLLLAWIFWGIAQWIGPLTTLVFARILGLSLGYRELSLISILRLPAKYLPGGIWQSVARFTAYSQHEVKKADSLAILIIEHLLAFGVSAALGAALLLHTENIQQSHHLATWTLFGALTVLAIALLGFLKVRGGGIKAAAGIFMAMLTTTLFWVAAATSFCEYWAAAFSLQFSDVIRVASCYLLSWAAGFAALFAPQGLGVFEWVSGHLLPSSRPLGVTITVIAGFRLVTLAADLSVWMLALVITRIDCGRNLRT